MPFLDQANPRIPRRPFAQPLGRPIGRRIIEDHELEGLDCLVEDAFNRDVEIRHRIVNRHDDADLWSLGSS